LLLGVTIKLSPWSISEPGHLGYDEMNKKILVAVVVAVLFVAGWFLFGKKEKATAPTSGTSKTQSDQNNKDTGTASNASDQAQTQTNSVMYTNSGFSPNEITVKVGTEVTFGNGSSKQMWVASDPHPTHTDLPGFDAKQAMGTGESFKYIFKKAGTFGYHNHINPSDTGKVIVEP
jgi:plastocyanin